MLEKRGNLWTYPPLNAWRVVPLGGTTFQQAMQRFPELAPLMELPRAKKIVAERCYQFTGYGLKLHVITMPIPRAAGLEEPSIVALERIIEDFRTFIAPKATYVMPRIGCGVGGYDWVTQVRPLLLTLPDNVIVVTR